MRTKINVFILALLNDDLKIIGPKVRLFSDFLSYRPKKKLKCTLNGYKFILTRTKNEIVSKGMVKIGSLVLFFIFSIFHQSSFLGAPTSIMTLGALFGHLISSHQHLRAAITVHHILMSLKEKRKMKIKYQF